MYFKQNKYFEFFIFIKGLKFLTQLCKEMGLSYEQYASELRKLEAEDYAVDYNTMVKKNNLFQSILQFLTKIARTSRVF